MLRLRQSRLRKMTRRDFRGISAFPAPFHAQKDGDGLSLQADKFFALPVRMKS